MNYAELSDAELSKEVAVRVAGWKKYKHNPLYWITESQPKQVMWLGDPRFATSADAVMELINKENWDATAPLGAAGYTTVTIFSQLLQKRVYGQAPTFVRAACLALLAAHSNR